MRHLSTNSSVGAAFVEKQQCKGLGPAEFMNPPFSENHQGWGGKKLLTFFICPIFVEFRMNEVIRRVRRRFRHGAESRQQFFVGPKGNPSRLWLVGPMWNQARWLLDSVLRL